MFGQGVVDMMGGMAVVWTEEESLSSYIKATARDNGQWIKQWLHIHYTDNLDTGKKAKSFCVGAGGIGEFKCKKVEKPHTVTMLLCFTLRM